MTLNPVSCEAFVRMDLTPPIVSEGIVSVSRQQKWPEGIPIATERSPNRPKRMRSPRYQCFAVGKLCFKCPRDLRKPRITWVADPKTDLQQGLHDSCKGILERLISYAFHRHKFGSGRQSCLSSAWKHMLGKLAYV